MKPGCSLFVMFANYYQIRSQLSSAMQRTAALAQQSGAVRCRALSSSVVQCGRVLWCGAILCGSMPCCAVLRAVIYILVRTCQVSFDQVSYSSNEVHHTRFVRTTLWHHKKCTPSSAQHSYSYMRAQTIAVQCRAVPLLALPCGAVTCCAVVSFEPTVPGSC